MRKRNEINNGLRKAPCGRNSFDFPFLLTKQDFMNSIICLERDSFIIQQNF